MMGSTDLFTVLSNCCEMQMGFYGNVNLLLKMMNITIRLWILCILGSADLLTLLTKQG